MLKLKLLKPTTFLCILFVGAFIGAHAVGADLSIARGMYALGAAIVGIIVGILIGVAAEEEF